MAAQGKRKVRFAGTIAAYALVGLVTSLAIAWCSPSPNSSAPDALWLGPPDSSWGNVPPALTAWVSRKSEWYAAYYHSEILFWTPREPPDRASQWDPPAVAARFPSRGYGLFIPADPTLFNENDAGYIEAEFRGFPFCCVWAWKSAQPGDDYPLLIRGSYLNCSKAFGFRPFPGEEIAVVPLWPGLIANTIIWGFAWFAIVNLPLRLLPWSAASRRRRGLCIACGYDLTGSQGRCPECGVDVAPATVRRG